jgi:hypothetical protein
VAKHESGTRVSRAFVAQRDAANVGQVGNLPPIANRPAESLEKAATGQLPIGAF